MEALGRPAKTIRFFKRRCDLTPALITTVVAAYAAIVSTLSLILAIKVYRAANPQVEVDWTYSAPDRKLVVSVHNTGRADVTINTVDLYVERHVITRRSRVSDAYAERVDMISHIPAKLWLRKPKTTTFPTRLASHSMFSFGVKNDAISLPSQYPLNIFNGGCYRRG